MKLDKHTKSLLKDPHKRRAWVIYQLSLQGRTLADIARAAGVNRQTLYQVWDRRYPRMEKLVADAVGLAPVQVFPDRYDADGLPRRHRGGASCPCCHGCKDTSGGACGNVHDGEAA